MNFIKKKIQITDNGFGPIKRLYQAENCNGCPVRDLCNKSKSNIIIEINERLNHYISIIKKDLPLNERKNIEVSVP